MTKTTPVWDEHCPAMSNKPPRILVIGYGNPGRRDDGLGPAFAERLAAELPPGVTVETTFQLAIEHSDGAARHDIVVFVDADLEVGPNAPFSLRPIQSDPLDHPFSHHLSPQAVLHLADQCFDARPKGWVLGIRPADLDSFAEGLTPEAQGNLEAALARFRHALATGELAT